MKAIEFALKPVANMGMERVKQDHAEAATPAESTPVQSWYLLGLLFLVYMFSSVDRLVIGLIVEPLKTSFHLSDSLVGFLIGFAYSIPFAIASLPIGVLVDRLPRLKLLAAILMVWSLTTSVGWLASSFVMLAVARMAVGASEAGVIPAGLSLLADAFPPRRRAAAMGVFYAGSFVAPLLIFIVGASVLAAFGWRAVFLIAGAPGLLLALLLLTTAKEPPRGAFEPVSKEANVVKSGLMRTLRVVIATPAIRYTVIANTIIAGVSGTFGFWVISFFARVHHAPFHKAAMIAGLSLGVVGAAGAMLSGPLIDRVAKGDPAKTALFPTIASAGGAIAGLAMVMAPTLPVVVCAYAFLCLMLGASLGPGHVLLLGVSPVRVRGSISSVDKLMSILVGAGAFSWLAGAISDRVGGADGIRFGLMAVMCFLFFAALFFRMAGLAWSRQERLREGLA